MTVTRISDLGEKHLISGFLRPLFNPADEVGGVGDDCAMIEAGDKTWLFSTDRVPADLAAFRLGILDYGGLGGYLARLNISDIAACGGTPLALLLNLGLPADLEYSHFVRLCQDFGRVASNYNCKVLGGDITASSEISVSATAIGVVDTLKLLTRRGASAGDTIFVSRPVGLTPAAFVLLLQSSEHPIDVRPDERELLSAQFTSLAPMVSLGRLLGESGACTSCMDNTDGVGQSLVELAAASRCSFVVDRSSLEIPSLVARIAREANQEPFRLALSAGADFSLVGTLRGPMCQNDVTRRFGQSVRVIGSVEFGEGVFVVDSSGRQPVDVLGWNYFDKGERGPAAP